MSPVLDELRQSPRLGQYLDELNRFLREEAAARRRFLEDVDEGTKAEFINGEPILHSPARYRHTKVVSKLHALLMAWVEPRDIGAVGSEKMMISLTRNDYEPDVVFFGREKAAGFRPDQMRFPAPDFVAEVLSDSTRSRDRGVKFEDFAAHGVAEYWIVDPETETLERYLLEGETYVLAPPPEDGIARSGVVPGFAIPIRALFDRDVFAATLARFASA